MDNNFVLAEKMRSREFDDMQLKEVIRKEVRGSMTDILVFENPYTHICRDLIVFNGHFYCTDLYNGLLHYNRDNVIYSFSFV